MWNVPKMVKTLDSVLWQASPGKSSLDVAALGCPPFFAGAFLLPCGVSKRYGSKASAAVLCLARWLLGVVIVTTAMLPGRGPSRQVALL